MTLFAPEVAVLLVNTIFGDLVADLGARMRLQHEFLFHFRVKENDILRNGKIKFIRTFKPLCDQLFSI